MRSPNANSTGFVERQPTEHETVVGVSLALPEPFSSRVQASRRAIGDPAADLIPTHVTLVPPTIVGTADLAATSDLVRAVTAEASPFTVRLRGTGSFRPVSPVVFLTIVRGIGDLQVLVEQLLAGPLEQTLRFPYHPHVTLGYNVADEALDRAEHEFDDVDLTFMAHGLHLYHRDDSGAWHPTEFFPFGP